MPKTINFVPNSFLPLALTLAAGSLLSPARAATLTDPPTVLFGKVVHVGNGAVYQLHSGSLSLQLVRTGGQEHVVSLRTRLEPIGPAGELSYRIEIPVKHLPEEDELSGSLAVGFEKVDYAIQSLTIDGVEARPIDSAQTLLSTHFSNRAVEHRLDLEVSLPQPDADGDGMPDWWEKRYGLNIHLASDAALDGDGDGLSNLAEFLKGTHPGVANLVPLVQTTSLLVPLGGRSGFHLEIVDTDTAPDDLTLIFQSIPEGLRLHRGGQELSDGAEAGYEEILGGNLHLDVAADFASGVLEVEVRDDGTSTVASSVHVSAFSPRSLAGAAPVAWLDAGSLPGGASVDEWLDRSGGRRDAYQPIADRQPEAFETGREAVHFAGDRFLYFDDRALDPSELTAFFAFKPDELGPEQTLFRSGALEVAIGGADSPAFPHFLKVAAAGRQLRAGRIRTGEDCQVTIRGGATTSVRRHGEPFVISKAPAVDDLLPASFATIGAARETFRAEASGFFVGDLHEIILYDQQINAVLGTRNEDYQRSRWSELVVWDFRDQVIPLTITGSPSSPNAISGGWSHDRLTGGALADTLRGGPGDDTLTGGAGADRFQFFPGHGNDRITDFSPEEGDVIDLTGIWPASEGHPSDYVRMRLRISRVTGQLPRTDAVIEMDHDGAGGGWTVDQSILLEGQNLGSNALPRLVGEGSLVLGGLRYETAITVESPAGGLLENGLVQPIVITRTGNLDAAMEIALVFSGSAERGIDYTLPAAPEPAALRFVSFARGQREVILDIRPIADAEVEVESISIRVLGDPRLTAGTDLLFEIPIIEAPPFETPQFTILAERHAVTGPGGRAGRFATMRTGPDLDTEARIRLVYGGSAANGGDLSLPGSVDFAAGQTSILLEVSPLGTASAPPIIDHLTARLVPDNPNQTLSTPNQATLLFLPPGTNEAGNLSDWLATEFPGNASPNLAWTDSDGDMIANIWEFLGGSSPHVKDAGGNGPVAIRLDDGKAVLETSTRAGWTGAALTIQRSEDLKTWQDASSSFDASYQLLPSGRLRQTFTAKENPQGLLHFRMTATPLSAVPGMP
ncbi:MAG TPA: calcium-binding protein [Verrucomicrobiales bacterium]|nr:calcium-binding protein [Verrucomicrobiales bacterium]